MDLSHLKIPFTFEEVEKVVKSLPPDKSPGPDGFTNRFFASCWSIIKLDLIWMCFIVVTLGACLPSTKP